MRSISLRVVIPGLMVGIFVLGTVTMMALEHQAARQRLVEERQNRVAYELLQFKQMAEGSYRRNLGGTVDSLLARMATQPEYQVLIVLDEQQRILHALRLGRRGKLAEDVIPEFTQRPSLGTTQVQDGTLESYQPITLMRSGRPVQGALFARYSFTPLLEEMDRRLMQRAGQVVMLGLGFGLLLAGLVQWLLMRPLARIAEATRRIANGDAEQIIGHFPTREFTELAENFEQTARVLRESTQALRERQALLESFASATPDLCLVLNEEPRCLAVLGNTSLLAHDLTPEDLVGQLVMPPNVAPDLLLDARQRIQQVMISGEPGRLDYTMPVNGTNKHFVARIIPLSVGYQGQPAVVWLATDDTEDKLLEHELRLMATAFETHEAIIVTDADGRILRTNSAFEEITGLQQREIIGRRPAHLSSHPDRERLETLISDALLRDDHWNGENVFRRVDGSVFPVMETITAVRDEDGRLINYVIVCMDISERKQAEQLIAWQARYDPLTELPNRRFLLERLDEQIALAKRRDFQGAVLFLDLDRFKPINDSLGHPVGDQLLIAVTQRLRQRLRREDFFARIGGDEFVVMLAPVEHDAQNVAREADQLGHTLLSLLSEPFHVAGQQLYIGGSIGFCIFPEQGDVPSDILRRADTAMYAVKRSGRSSVRQFRPEMESDSQAKLSLLSELHKALEREEFRLVFQPQQDAQGNITGAEALLRWQHPEQGMIPPDRFIPLAEESGLILPIGDWVLRQSAFTLKRLRDSGMLPDTFKLMAVNVSARQFTQPDFANRFVQMLDGTGIMPSEIEIELTESVLADNLQTVSAVMQELRTAGFHFAIDDFGTGYSSLHYLKRLPVDTLKIDRTFVNDLPHDESDTRIVETILAMASHLGLRVVAEGVEEAVQMEFLRMRGCHFYQGYYITRPLPADEFQHWLSRRPG